MNYPPAPWDLRGVAYQNVQLVDCARVRPFVPPNLKLLSVLPGKTVGGLYLASYGAGSTLEYHELIVLAGLVRYSGHFGGWISHIYVDSAASQAGGREVWGLPKELARFTWETGEPGRIVVQKDHVTLCTLHCRPPQGALRLWFPWPVLSLRDARLLAFRGDFTARPSLMRAHWHVPPESPFAALGLGRTRWTFGLDRLRLRANAPHVLA